MSKALVKSSASVARGAIPAVASAILPGAGQLINGQTNKALGVFAVWGIAGLGIFGLIPVIGQAAWLVGGAAWLYGVADGYFTGKGNR